MGSHGFEHHIIMVNTQNEMFKNLAEQCIFEILLLKTAQALVVIILMFRNIIIIYVIYNINI